MCGLPNGANISALEYSSYTLPVFMSAYRHEQMGAVSTSPRKAEKLKTSRLGLSFGLSLSAQMLQSFQL